MLAVACFKNYSGWTQLYLTMRFHFTISNPAINGLKQLIRGDMIEERSDWSAHSQNRNAFT